MKICDRCMSQMTRLEELENALRRVIEYLGRLPLHPMTRQAANDAERVLNSSKMFPQQYSSSRFDPAGVLLFSVRASGKIITISTAADMPDQYRERHKDMTYRMLVHGVTMPPLSADE